MYLRDQCIEEDNGILEIVRQARRLSNNDGGVGRRRGIDNASEESETTMVAARIRGRQRRLRRLDDGPD